MAEDARHIRVGKGADGTFCFGFDLPLPSKVIPQFPREGLQPTVHNNDDGTQTVGYKHWQFGWKDTDRWQDFTVYAMQVRNFVAKNVFEGKVILHLEPRLLEGSEKSLYLENYNNP